MTKSSRARLRFGGSTRLRTAEWCTIGSSGRIIVAAIAFRTLAAGKKWMWMILALPGTTSGAFAKYDQGVARHATGGQHCGAHVRFIPFGTS